MPGSGRDGALRRPAFANATAGRPRRVQRCNQGRRLFAQATLFGGSGSSTRFCAGHAAKKQSHESSVLESALA